MKRKPSPEALEEAQKLEHTLFLIVQAIHDHSIKNHGASSSWGLSANYDPQGISKRYREAGIIIRRIAELRCVLPRFKVVDSPAYGPSVMDTDSGLIVAKGTTDFHLAPTTANVICRDFNHQEIKRNAQQA